MKRLLSTLWMLLILSSLGFTQNTTTKHHSEFPLNCQECHLCKKPTAEKPCLKIMPSFQRKGIQTKHSLSEAPDFVLLDTLSKAYNGVIFSHKMHAEMAQMSGGCESCHHHNPPGKILKCSTCHSPDSRGKNVDKPDLEGAYHQLCIDCHRTWDTSWSKKTDCTTCHQKKSGTMSKATLDAKIKVLKTSHGTVNVPNRFVLKSDNEDAPWVIFPHRDHAEDYTDNCTSCHKNENCVECHGPHPKRELSHDNCISCHEQDIDENCQKCHFEKKPQP